MNWNNPIIVGLISFIVGNIGLTFFSVILPRKKTIGFGITIWKFLSKILCQKQPEKLPISNSIWNKIMVTIESTLTDLSFGIYIASREYNNEKLNEEIEKYIHQEEVQKNYEKNKDKIKKKLKKEYPIFQVDLKNSKKK